MSYGSYSYGSSSLATAGGASNYSNALSDGGSAATRIVAGWNNTASDNGVGHASAPVALLTAMLSDQGIAISPLAAQQAMQNAASDNASGYDALCVAFDVLASTSANASDGLTSVYNQIAQLVDTLIALDPLLSVQAAKAVIIEAATARDSLLRTFPISLSDSGVGGDLAASLLAANIAAVDTAIAASTLAYTASITFALTDSAVAADTSESQLSAFDLLIDGARAVVTLSLNGNVFTGVVLNAETSGVSEYTNFPFNSFAFFNGQYYGGADDGIYALAGDSDNGAPVIGAVRTGLIRMSDGLRTQVPYAYIGVTTDGDILFKVITTSPQGAKNEQWYRFEKRTAGAPRETRVKIGRGLSSVYWQFELVNITGADFAFDSVQLAPIALERRV